MRYLAMDQSRHRDMGITLAKYVETLQRSNEQLVKIISIQSKKTESSNVLSDTDKESLFDMIQTSGNVPTGEEDVQ